MVNAQANSEVEVLGNLNFTLTAYNTISILPKTKKLTRKYEGDRGNKVYEITNPVTGNVHVVVSDRKLAVDDGTYSGGVKINSTPDGIMDYFEPDVLVARDFFPFGSILPGRSFNSSSYRLGFNGMEKDDEITGVTGSHYTAEFWEYDSRTGRRWNVDPMVYPWQSSYAAFNNNPIVFSDPLGLFGSRKEAREYKQENNVKGRIQKGEDGVFAINNRVDGISTFNDEEFGLQTAALIRPERGNVDNTPQRKAEIKEQIEDYVSTLKFIEDVERGGGKVEFTHDRFKALSSMFQFALPTAKVSLSSLKNVNNVATPITKNSVIEGFNISNHAFRKSGLGRGATEELISTVIKGAQSSGNVIVEVGTGQFQGNIIKVFNHNGVKVAVDETRSLIMSIRPEKGFKLN